VVVAEHWSSEKNLFTRSSCLPFELAIFGGKRGKREKKKKTCSRPADVASLQCHPLPRCWHASIVVAMRVFIQTHLLPCHTSAPLFMHAVCTPLVTPLPPCSCTRFALLSSHHREFHTFHSKRNGQFNLSRSANLLHPTDSGTEGVGHRQRVKGVVGGAKKARAHIHAQACG
jgi:hypothetical protein